VIVPDMAKTSSNRLPQGQAANLERSGWAAGLNRSLDGMQHLSTLPLHEQEIQPGWLGDSNHRQNRVCLPTVMCLVIEQMGEGLPAALLP